MTYHHWSELQQVLVQQLWKLESVHHWFVLLEQLAFRWWLGFVLRVLARDLRKAMYGSPSEICETAGFGFPVVAWICPESISKHEPQGERLFSPSEIWVTGAAAGLVAWICPSEIWVIGAGFGFPVLAWICPSEIWVTAGLAVEAWIWRSKGQQAVQESLRRLIIRDLGDFSCGSLWLTVGDGRNWLSTGWSSHVATS